MCFICKKIIVLSYFTRSQNATKQDFCVNYSLICHSKKIYVFFYVPIVSTVETFFSFTLIILISDNRLFTNFMGNIQARRINDYYPFSRLPAHYLQPHILPFYFKTHCRSINQYANGTAPFCNRLLHTRILQSSKCIRCLAFITLHHQSSLLIFRYPDSIHSVQSAFYGSTIIEWIAFIAQQFKRGIIYTRQIKDNHFF